jgi:hypothetical protein
VVKCGLDQCHYHVVAKVRERERERERVSKRGAQMFEVGKLV